MEQVTPPDPRKRNGSGQRGEGNRNNREMSPRCAPVSRESQSTEGRLLQRDNRVIPRKEERIKTSASSHTSIPSAQTQSDSSKLYGTGDWDKSQQVEWKGLFYQNTGMLTGIDPEIDLPSEEEWQKMSQVDDNNDLQDTDRLCEDMREAFIEGPLKNAPFSFLIAILNMNGQSIGKGTAEKRRKVIERIYKTHMPSIIFCQELTGKTGQLMENFKLDPNIFDIKKNGAESAILWNKEKFVQQELKSDIWRMGQEMEGSWKEFHLRACVVKFEALIHNFEERVPFLAVSWHGPHTRARDEEKVSILQKLLVFVKKIAENEGTDLPFFIGGDFNINTVEAMDAIENSEEFKGIICQVYETDHLTKSKNQNNKRGCRSISFKENIFSKDVFITYPKAITLHDDLKFDEFMLTLSAEEREEWTDKLLDHPVFTAVLNLVPFKYAYKFLNGQTLDLKDTSSSR